jgi:hypothetical protein
MSSMVVRRYRNANVVHPIGGYQEPFVITVPTFDHKDGHYVRPNRVVLKYLDFKKKFSLDAHVKMFNFVIKENVETTKEYIKNVFNYMLRDTSLVFCHNYMSKFLDCTFGRLHKHFANVIERFRMTRKYTWS